MTTRFVTVIAVPFFLFIHIAFSWADSGLEEFPGVIAKVKNSMVGVGTYQKTRRPPFVFRGTGFAIGDGRIIVTNAHVIPEKIDERHREFITVVSGSSEEGVFHKATVLAKDEDHDLCLLKISGPALPPMMIGDDSLVKEGELFAFTGFPIGLVLGLHPVTHRGIVSAITPIAIPMLSGRQINGEMVERLKKPYPVFQLDATAYPGNSGSPLYDIKTGHVIGIINMVFVKRTKESAITDPSGITYAIPARFLKEMMRKTRN